MVSKSPVTFWLTRIVFLRCLGLVYFTAFLVAFTQNPQLLGNDGLLPACAHLNRIKPHMASTWDAFLAAPTLLWFTGCSDWMLQAIPVLGMVVAAIPAIFGCANMILLSMLWILYHSLNSVGQNWYSFGWESQLLETGFLAVWVVPVLTLHPLPKHTPVPSPIVFCFRWLLFRIMLGAGLIKVRGDQCWRDMTCMQFHYETQPVPNPLSPFYHFQPAWFHTLGTWVNHVVELLAPFLMLMSRNLRVIGGVVQIGFQAILISSGNLSFLNHLTILPGIFCLDDDVLKWLFSRKVWDQVVALRVAATPPVSPVDTQQSRVEHNPPDVSPESTSLSEQTGLRQRRRGPDASQSSHDSFRSTQQPQSTVQVRRKPRWRAWHAFQSRLRSVIVWSVTALIAYLSFPVLLNLLSPTQTMNRTFSSFALVNTYGAFGSVGRQRPELILQGTNRSDFLSPDTVWLDYEFPCKPGDLSRRPCVISPFHYRMDWLLWFAAMADYQQYPWLVHLVDKLLQGDTLAHRFFVTNPFPDAAQPPTAVRILRYDYRFTPASLQSHVGRHAGPLSKEVAAALPSQWKWDAMSDIEVGTWWTRRFMSEYLPPLSADNPSLHKFLRGYGWTPAAPSTPVDVQLLYQNTVQITAVLLFVLLLKMFYSNCMLGAARIFAGKRPPEDVYQAKSDRVSQEMLAAEDRARRIVSNDIENIPVACALSLASLQCLNHALESGHRHVMHLLTAHCALLLVFTALRLAHTYTYQHQHVYWRALVWFSGVGTTFLLGCVAIYAAFTP